MSLLTRLFGPKREPELSCFIKGVIKSIRETPKEWSLNEDSWWWKHASSQVEVSKWGVYNAGHYLTKDEERALRDAIQTYLIDPPLAARRKVFERLGCPDKP